MRQGWSYPKPREFELFENMCRASKELFGANALQRFGRSGQDQHGIDLLGSAPDGELIGVQCKVRDKGALALKDIEKDVERAREIEPKLRHFVVATTAARDKKLQLAIARLDEESRAMGLFSIRIFFWDDFQDFFDDRPDVVRKFRSGVGPDDALRIESVVLEVKSLAMTLLQQSEEKILGSGDGFDRRIDDAHRQSCDGDPRGAIAILEQIRRRDWERLDARLRFRVLANLGGAHAMLGDLAKAADLRLQARSEFDSDRSRELEVLAWHWRGDQARAREMAEELIGRAPDSVIAHAICIAAHPGSMTLDEAAALVPVELRSNPTIQSVLASVARDNGDLDAAIPLARAAANGSDDWTTAALDLADLLVRRFAATDITGGAGGSGGGQQLLLEVIQITTSLLDRLGEGATTPARPRALLLRSIARRRLGQLIEANADLMLAHRALPTDPCIAASRALLYAESHQLDDAIRVLEEVTEPRALRFHGLLAQLLLDRNGPGDRERAVDVIASNLDGARDEDPRVVFSSAKLLCNACAALGRGAEAIACLAEDGPLMSLPPPVRRVLRAYAQIESGAQEEARQTLREASIEERLALDTEPRRLALKSLANLGLWREIFATLAGQSSERIDASDAAYFIEAAAACAEHGALLAFFEARRAAIEPTRRHAKIEVETLLEYGENDAAIARLTCWLDAHPDDADARLWRSAVALESGRLDLVQTDPASLPNPEECEPELGFRAVQLWGSAPSADWARLQAYAYRIWRRRPDDIDACHAVIASHFMAVAHGWTGAEIEAVGLDVAVQLRRSTGEGFWITIEQGQPCPLPDHYGPEEPISRALMGAKVGDERELPSGMGLASRVVVERLVRPVVHRAYEVASSWDRRFPTRAVVSMMHLPTAPTEPMNAEEAARYLQPLKEIVERDAAAREGRESRLGSAGWPRWAVAKVIGRSIFAATGYLAERSDRTLRCCAGDDRELRDAERALERSRAAVIDITALATLALLGRIGLLSRLRLRLVVTQSTIVAFRRHIRECERGCGESLGWQDGDLRLIRDDPDVRARYIRDLEDGLAMVLAAAEVVGGRPLADRPKETRDQLEHLIGAASAQSAAVAAAKGIPLWTDDYAVSLTSKELLGVESVWIAALLQVAERGEEIDSTQVDELLGRLYVAGYRHTSLRSSVVVHALRAAGWDPNKPHAAAVLSSFGDKDISSRSMVLFVLGSLAQVWSECRLIDARMAIGHAILRALDCHPDGRRIGRHIRGGIDLMFGLDAVGAAEVHGLVTAWLEIDAVIRPHGPVIYGPDGTPFSL